MSEIVLYNCLVQCCYVCGCCCCCYDMLMVIVPLYSSNCCYGNSWYIIILLFVLGKLQDTTCSWNGVDCWGGMLVVILFREHSLDTIW